MQTYRSIHALALAGLIGLATGCDKKTEPPPPPKAGEAGLQKQVETAAGAVKETAEKGVAAATAAATQAVQAVSQPATDATAKAQSIIDSAKQLVSQGKWQELGQTLPKLQGLKLTPEQEKTLADLKAQLEKVVQAAASKQPAIPGGLVPPK